MGLTIQSFLEDISCSVIMGQMPVPCIRGLLQAVSSRIVGKSTSWGHLKMIIKLEA